MDMLTRATAHETARVSLAINRALWRSLARPENDLREVAKSIRAPVLLMFGEKDPAISTKLDGATATRSISHAETFTPPCGVAPFAELPEVFLNRVIPLLQKSFSSVQ